MCVCPPSPPALADPERNGLEQDLAIALAGLPMIRFLSSARLLELYPVTNYYDAAADKLGHIPYTPDAYAILGTAIARVFHASQRAPYKVIALDCDNTLWRGICGETGPHGVELDAPARAVQNFVKARQKDGMLLCVCSKNATEDVERVFDEHPEMPLARSDFAGWRVNWRPKSENIRSLAAELSLGLDSFILLDDNPMETAEVESNCPGVLALTLPAEVELIPRFLDHVWAFDQNGITAEDRNRTAMVRENASRSRLLTESLSYADFLASLELEVEIRELNGAAEIARAAQMTQRTNQFNFTTQRLTEPEIREALSSGSMEILTAFVRDRFGNYGQVGLVMYQAVDDVLRVQNLLLSCRVLGKGVEHAMVARLGQIAVERSLSDVEIPYSADAEEHPGSRFSGKPESSEPSTPFRGGGRSPILSPRKTNHSHCASRWTGPRSDGPDFPSLGRLCVDRHTSQRCRRDSGSGEGAQEIARGCTGRNSAARRDWKDGSRAFGSALCESRPSAYTTTFSISAATRFKRFASWQIWQPITPRDLPLATLLEAPTIENIGGTPARSLLEASLELPGADQELGPPSALLLRSRSGRQCSRIHGSGSSDSLRSAALWTPSHGPGR